MGTLQRNGKRDKVLNCRISNETRIKLNQCKDQMERVYNTCRISDADVIEHALTWFAWIIENQKAEE